MDAADLLKLTQKARDAMTEWAGRAALQGTRSRWSHQDEELIRVAVRKIGGVLTESALA